MSDAARTYRQIKLPNTGSAARPVVAASCGAVTNARLTLFVRDRQLCWRGFPVINHGFWCGIKSHPRTTRADRCIFMNLPVSKGYPDHWDRIFPLFEKPENPRLITPPSLGHQLLTPSPVEMKQGQNIDYQIRLNGIPLHWQSLISTYDPPNFFADGQLRGRHGY